MKDTPGFEMIRSFLALEISEDARDWIMERSGEIKRQGAGSIRWVKRDALHLTLHFFGDLPKRTIEQMTEILTPLAEAFSPFLLKVKEIGAFPNLRNPRVLWAGIEDMTEGKSLRSFHAKLREALERAGFPVDKRPFTPHITIGRIKKFSRFDWQRFKKLPDCPPFTVSELTFFKSDLTPKGAIYQPLNRFSLGGKKA